jgi:hypothetical protein
MEQLKLQMRLLPLHMRAATAPSIPHALQMELLKPKLIFHLGRMASLYNQSISHFSSILNEPTHSHK